RMNKDQLKELLEGLTTSFAQVANTIANSKKDPEERRELTHNRPKESRGENKWKSEGSSEKRCEPKKGNEEKKVNNYVEVTTSYIDNDSWEDEVYTLGENRYQPYEGNSKKVAQAQPETRWENWLRTRENVVPQTL
ncbi:954_t:CDS:2, partial [Dentiscutata heterogama]